MYAKIVFSVSVLFFFAFQGKAQDCTLDVGGKNTDLLVQVFQMNEQQVAKMESLAAELQIEIKVIEDEIQRLFDTHPQSTPEELTTLSKKYKVMQQKIVQAAAATDKMLLATFNERQYARYIELCHEAIRKPIQVVPVQLKDSIVDPK